MAGKAYLITYQITTRVVVDGDAPETKQLEQANTQAKDKIQRIDGYIDMDNIDDFVEDTEMPFGSDEKDASEYEYMKDMELPYEDYKNKNENKLK